MEARRALGELGRRLAVRHVSRRKKLGEIAPPAMSVLLDGKSVEPRQLVWHPCPTLQYVVTPDTMAEDTLRVFTQPAAAAEYVQDVQQRYAREKGVPRAVASAPGGRRLRATQGYHGPVGGYIELFEHIDYGGSRWTFWADWGTQRDFRRVYWNINDRVSSADCYVDYIDGNVPYDAFVILFEHINLGGNQLWLWSGAAPGGPGKYPDLGSYGWNDLASSLRYY